MRDISFDITAVDGKLLEFGKAIGDFLHHSWPIGTSTVEYSQVHEKLVLLEERVGGVDVDVRDCSAGWGVCTEHTLVYD